jgi:hypothetical protein
MEPVTIASIVIASVLACERILKYYIDHVKKSKCMGSEIEFKSNSSIKKNETTI